jgi:hypothetical protein
LAGIGDPAGRLDQPKMAARAAPSRLPLGLRYVSKRFAERGKLAGSNNLDCPFGVLMSTHTTSDVKKTDPICACGEGGVGDRDCSSYSVIRGHAAAARILMVSGGTQKTEHTHRE